MTTPIQEAQSAIQQSRQALSRGDRRLARQLAERAAKLAPQLEDPWLVLAAVAGPRAGLEYIQRALQVNPESARARSGMQWIMRRLGEVGQDVEATRETLAVRAGSTQQVRAQRRQASRTAPRRGPRRLLLPILLLALGCGILGLAGWTAINSPVVASMLPQALGTPEGTPAAQWAQAEIPKPTYTAPVPVIEIFPTATPEPETLNLPSTDQGSLSTDPSTEVQADLSTAIPTEVTAEPEIPTVEPTWSGTLSMEYVADTPTPEAPPYVPPAAVQPAPGGIPAGTRWIDVDLSQQMVYAYSGDTVVNSFLVSTGTWMTPTVTGKYKIWIKLRYSDMSGPDYYLPNVPYVMYFYKGYGFHGTYWHNNFGTPMSHGCVNLSIPDSEWLYNFASEGTVVNVHY